MVVGLSSDVITNRQPAVSPGNQLARAREYMSMGVKSTEICFSYNVRSVPADLIVHVLCYISSFDVVFNAVWCRVGL